jgi:NAD(P)H-quinone oxidoreductase subunit 5
MNLMLAILAVSGPLLLMVSAVLPSGWSDRRPAIMRRLTLGAAHTALLTSLLSVAGFLFLGMEVIDQSLAGLEIFLDALSAIMLLLMAGVGTMVIRYSLRYLDGDPGQGHFLKWLSLTMGLVLLLIIWRHAEPDHDGDHGGGELDQSPVLRLNGR